MKKYSLSILFTVFIYVSLMLSHSYLPHSFDLIYKAALAFFIILLSFRDVISIIFSCFILALFFWLSDQYIAHPLDYIIQATTICLIVLVSLFLKNKKAINNGS